ncbi:HCL379Wp [Eremothecium sinecaudum]|uniref:Helicase SWR1 n=1 Tax=Eremothecium sinecaudum TaxID=45286 RepID=A0A120K1V5_9SACH|nr:HCL379Wp [Eremothecium sinecaudum]AMD19772.1 HCL379Wp [Eremothecium sinecaudum]
MTQGSQSDQLATWYYEYDLLTNELFHLHEFTSLLEFDPAYRNESDAFRVFLEDCKLSLNVADDERDANIEESNAARRIRRRQKRMQGSGSDEERILEIRQRVAEMYFQLERRLQGSSVEANRPEGADEDHRTDKRKRKRPDSGGSVNKMKKVGKNGRLVVKGEDTREDIRGDEEDELTNTKDTGVKMDILSSDADVTGCKLPMLGPVNEEEYDSFYFTTSSEDEGLVGGDDRSSKRGAKVLPRIKILVQPPKQTITNYLHANKPDFSSLHEFLQSYRSLDEDLSIEEYQDYIAEQRKTIAALQRGFERGVLRYDAATDSIQGISIKDVQSNQWNKAEPISVYYKEQEKLALHDHLVNHGVAMSKVFQENKRLRISRARKVSQMIEQHFKHIAGAEERKSKEEEKRRKALARVAIQAVKKRWGLAERAYRVLKKDEEEQLKRIQGKKHLSKMLEQSTQLLGAQLNQFDSDDSDTGTEYSDSEEVDSDEVMSTSSSEAEDDHQGTNAEDDSKLTVEELRDKYSGIDQLDDGSPNPKLQPSSAEIASDYDQQSTEQSVIEEERTLTSALNECEDSVLDEDDSGSLSEDTGSDVDSVSSDQSSDTTQTKQSQLASLFDQMDDDEADVEVRYSSDEPSSYEERDLSDKSDDVSDENPSLEPIAASPETLDEKDKPRPRTPNDSLSVVDVPIPSLLRGVLRIYQKQGLNWLASLYNNNTNGILADEMGLGKTIQTISLLAYLACEKENWGPHLIIVPTSVLLNWEMEFKRFAPGFKVLTYYGSPQQRKEKRKGWNKPDAFHVCITSYQLVVHDQHSFKRKRWQYMILDEAHNIKNFRSTRWQALLNFNTRRRLLLTGTPLQNNIAELWSLLYFLMPQTAMENGTISGFADLAAFQQWFGKPVDRIIATEGEHDDETKQTVSKLHQVLRPYLLRRLKADVEKQMPAKYEHIVYCRLSKRQRFLYDDFMSRAQTKATLASGNFMSIINCLMQLRKVCNHPDLFEVRPILTSFCIDRGVTSSYNSLNQNILKRLHENDIEQCVNLQALNFLFTYNDFMMTTNTATSTAHLQCVTQFADAIRMVREETAATTEEEQKLNYQNINEFYKGFTLKNSARIINHYGYMKYLNTLRCEKKPIYGSNLIKLLTLNGRYANTNSDVMSDLMKPLETRLLTKKDMIQQYAIVTPNVVVLDNRELILGLNQESVIHSSTKAEIHHKLYNMDNPFHQLQTKLSIAFPDKSLLQYDCGKLQNLAILLQNLKENGHRALIFTQMTKVLDILEQFLNYHGYLYLRLDGATKVEDRQILTERFNSDSRITAFILSSRSGGLGINLTGADTVIFYDSDWNPAMDKQCQDRCHRIGQTRDVHIYRFVSEHTIESNILKKANQKRQLDNIVIQKGDFTTDYFTKLSVKDLLGSEAPEEFIDENPLLLEGSAEAKDSRKLEKLLAHAEDEDDVMAARLAMKEVDLDDGDFREGSMVEGSVEDEDDVSSQDEYEGTKHVEEYMIRFIANGYLYD